MNRLVDRLKTELALSNDIDRSAELLARIGIAEARLGDFEAARRSMVRARALCGHVGRVGTIWIMLCEALIQHFEEQSPAAQKRINAVVMLSSAIGNAELLALASAWRAHGAFESSDFDAMFESLSIAALNATDDNLDSQTRVSMVIANVFAIAGDAAGSREWFARGHRLAVVAGDQASIEGLLYNRVALNLAALRVSNCIAPVSELSIRILRSEYQSACNLNTLFQATTLASHLALIDARLTALEGRFEEARSKLLVARTMKPFAANHVSEAYIDLEIAYCANASQNRDLVNAYFAVDRRHDFSKLDMDEQLVAAWMLTSLSSVDARFGDNRTWSHSLDDQLVAHAKFQEDLRARLEALLAESQPSE